eukprot:361696-Chlamydomonas_euryale.AAC.2
MCNKAPKRTPELQGSDFKAPATSTTSRGFFAETFWWGGGRRGCAMLRQLMPGFYQFRHPVTPYASCATPLDELGPQPQPLRRRAAPRAPLPHVQVWGVKCGT